MERCLYSVGVVKGGRVAAFVVQWAMAEAAEGGDELKIEQVADWWGDAHRTAYRRLAEFREVFPEFSTPHEICVIAARQAIDPSSATTVRVLTPSPQFG